MGYTNTIASLVLSTLIGFLCVVSSKGWATNAQRKSWEVSVQSFDDELKLTQSYGADVPLKARGNGFVLGYNSCFYTMKTHCAQFNGTLGMGWANVESRSSLYNYEDHGVPFYQGMIGVGAKYVLPKTLATLLLSGDLEVRSSAYRAPTTGSYSIEDEKLTLHYWIKTQFSFPVSKDLSVYQDFMFSPVSPDFSLRIGLAM
ncbi:MAG: hypothetical protein CL676_07525 [Bdellovibrionaceae bacterium]|nr:hypothetical protein [Pseudobdellovibrionaceae bacterium]|tara:strand:- start:5343 stop:5945 length:603 start_codon:yes stop_codon:yes gene_type:complete